MKIPYTLQKIKLLYTGRSLSEQGPDGRGNKYSLFSRRNKSTSPYNFNDNTPYVDMPDIKSSVSMSSFTPLLRSKSAQYSPDYYKQRSSAYYNHKQHSPGSYNRNQTGSQHSPDCYNHNQTGYSTPPNKNCLYYSAPDIPAGMSPVTMAREPIPHTSLETINRNSPRARKSDVSTSRRSDHVLRRQPRVRQSRAVSMQVPLSDILEGGGGGATELCTEQDCLPCSFLRPELRGRHHVHIPPEHVRNFD